MFNSDGTFRHAFGVHGSLAGQLNRPAGVAVNKNQEIIVADKDNHRIQVFTLEVFIITPEKTWPLLAYFSK